MIWNLNLASGGTIPVDVDEANRRSKELAELARNQRLNVEPKPNPWRDRAVYAGAYNDLTQKPVNSVPQGVETNIGRVWAEARGIEHTGSSGGVIVTLVSTQNGVSACVEVPEGQTLIAGSIRYWKQDPTSLRWGLGTSDVALATGEQRAWADEFVTVGAR